MSINSTVTICYLRAANIFNAAAFSIYMPREISLLSIEMHLNSMDIINIKMIGIFPFLNREKKKDREEGGWSRLLTVDDICTLLIDYKSNYRYIFNLKL